MRAGRRSGRATVATFAARAELVRSRVSSATDGLRELVMSAVRWRWATPAALAVLAIYSVYSRIFALDAPCSHPCRPPNGAGLIFDERYYVNAARVMLGWHVPPDAPYANAPAGSDPNSEHPPLAKLIMAAGMKIFGDGPLGWRIGSIIAGTVAVLAMFALVRAARGGRGLALGAAAVMALDNLAMVHGRIGTLDIYALAFVLVAAALYLHNHPVLAGVVLGVGGCSKLIAWYLVFVLLLFEAGRVLIKAPSGGNGISAGLRQALKRQGMFLGVAVATYFALLAALDAIVRPFDPNRNVYLANVFSHTWHMFQFASQQRSPHGPQGIASYPWEWLIDRKEIDYYTVTHNTLSGGTVISRHAVIAFRGAINPFLLFVAVPALAASLARVRSSVDDVDLLAVAWFAGMYLPLLAQVVLDDRTSYLYYMLIVLPGVYLAAARMFSRGLPRAATVGWGIALLAGFAAQYPIRTLNW